MPVNVKLGCPKNHTFPLINSLITLLHCMKVYEFNNVRSVTIKPLTAAKTAALTERKVLNNYFQYDCHRTEMSFTDSSIHIELLLQSYKAFSTINRCGGIDS